MQCEHHHGNLVADTLESHFGSYNICVNFQLPKDQAISKDTLEATIDLANSEESSEGTKARTTSEIHLGGT